MNETQHSISAWSSRPPWHANIIGNIYDINTERPHFGREHRLFILLEEEMNKQLLLAFLQYATLIKSYILFHLNRRFIVLIKSLFSLGIVFKYRKPITF